MLAECSQEFPLYLGVSLTVMMSTFVIVLLIIAFKELKS